MKLSKAERDDLHKFIAERYDRPEWRKPSPLDEYYTEFFKKIVLALAVVWMIILVVAVASSTMVWGTMLFITLGVSWLLAKIIFQRSSDIIQTLGTTLRGLDEPTKAKPLVKSK